MFLRVQSLFRPTTADILTRLSTTSTGDQANGASSGAQLSADGRSLLFSSAASNLVDGDGNARTDVFIKDLAAGTVTRVSTGTAGTEGNLSSSNAEFSPDGRFVTFVSAAGNLVAGDRNNADDIFLKNLASGEITLVSARADGTQGAFRNHSSNPHFSPDGNSILFESRASLVAGDTNGSVDIYRKNLLDGSITRLSTGAGEAQANGNSYDPQLSSDGRYLLFRSDATNLVEGDSNKSDLFRKDLQTGIVTLVSSSSDGTPANDGSGNFQLSADGRYVVFESFASNLVEGDTAGSLDIFIKDLSTGEVRLVSRRADGTLANGYSSSPKLSPDGRYVIFESEASNLVSNDTNGQRDVFLKDLTTGEVRLISAAAGGAPGSGKSLEAKFSSDGRYITFYSEAADLIGGDTNTSGDIFRVDTFYQPHAAAIAEGRFIETTLGVGAASRATIVWGDGTSSTVAPAGGTATFTHAYASTGIKAATVVLNEGALTWSVAHTINVSADTMTRNTAVADTLSGGAGNDSLTGDAFANRLIGNAGHDRLSASSGNDYLNAGLGNDSLFGGTGNDTLYGGTGNDRLSGSSGNDRLYADAGNDRLYADVGNDTLSAGAGNDLLSASTGNDRLLGGTGQDTLTGGTGRDVFVFDDRETSWSKSQADYITDFSGRMGDKIDLRAVDANTAKRGDQNFTFIGDEKSFSKAGEVRFEKTKSATYVYLNTDSDKSAEAVIKLNGSLELSKGWFVL